MVRSAACQIDHRPDRYLRFGTLKAISILLPKGQAPPDKRLAPQCLHRGSLEVLPGGLHPNFSQMGAHRLRQPSVLARSSAIVVRAGSSVFGVVHHCA
jgi:hypothetical protein